MAASVAGPGVNTFSLAGDPSPRGNGLAAGDLVAIRESDGVTRLYTVLTYTGGTLTLTTNLVAGVAVGSKVWMFGVEADTDPYTGAAHETYALPAGQTTNHESPWGFIGGHLPDQPVLVSIDNATNAGVLNFACWTYGSLGQVVLSSSDSTMLVGVA